MHLPFHNTQDLLCPLLPWLTCWLLCSQGCTSCGKPEADPNYDHSQAGRLFQFNVTETNNGKLDFARATALIYTLSMSLGLSTTGDLVPPNAASK